MEYNTNPKEHQVAKEYTSFVSSDTLRQYLKIQKNFYNLHTKKNQGYTDMNDVQYSGIIENEGNDILLESRKLLLRKPPIGNLIIDNAFRYYFNIQHSNCIDTYPLQSLLEATLKGDVLLSNKVYRICFYDCEMSDKVVLRSESTSDEEVRRVVLVHTKTPPSLLITENGKESEVPLRVRDDSYSIAHAFLLFKKENAKYPSETDEEYRLRFHSMLSIYLPQTKAEITYYFYTADGEWDSCNSDIISSIDKKTNTLQTKPLTNKWKNRPLIWFHSTTHQTLPDLEMIGNQDEKNQNILEIGTDGTHKHFLYPISYGIEHITGMADSNLDQWYLKAIPSTDRFVDDVHNKTNYDVSIDKISFIQTTEIGFEPIVEHHIAFNGDFKKITLCKNIPWLFRKPMEHDWDYKISIDNHNNQTIQYAYIPLSFFVDNIPTEDNYRNPLKPAFQVTFNHKFLYDMELLSGNATSGLHIGMSLCDSDHRMLQKNGILYNLGEFDGLPDYIQNEKSNTIPKETTEGDDAYAQPSDYRAHVEVYAIRDVATDDNQTVFDKQIAALLLDGGLPQHQLPDFLQSLRMTITYAKESDTSGNSDPEYVYKTTQVSESMNNWLSELTWMGYSEHEEFDRVGNFGNYKIPGQEELDKFYFHQNRTFSTRPYDEYDRQMEAARVYQISNDPSIYVNNDLATYQEKKPPRTMARIVDIPTSWLQLIGIRKAFPSIIIDAYYIRQSSSYTITQKEMVWNTLNRKWVWNTTDHTTNLTRIFHDNDKLDDILSNSFLETYYPKRINMTSFISIMDPDITFDIYLPGSSYEVNDVFRFFIGGNTVSGTIITMNGNEVTEIKLYRTELLIAVENLFQETIFETTASTGIGKGLSIVMNIKQDKWEKLQPRNVGMQDGLFTFRFDKRNNLWIWEYEKESNTWVSSLCMIGEAIDENEYDADVDYMSRTVRSTYLASLLKTRNELSCIGDASLQQNGLNVTLAFKEIGFDRMVSINEDIYIQYNNNVLVSNPNRNPKHYTITIHTTNDHTNWWDQITPTVVDEMKQTTTWSFDFKIENISLRYTFTDTKGDVNIQTTEIQVLTTSNETTDPRGNIVSKHLFEKNKTIVVNSKRSENATIRPGEIGPKISITLSDDYHTWLFASFCCFNLEQLEGASFVLLNEITEPSTFRVIIKDSITDQSYPVLIKYLLDDNQNLIGPIYLLECGDDSEKIWTEEERNLLRGHFIKNVIPFSMIKHYIRKGNVMSHTYSAEQIPDEWNEVVPVNATKLRVRLDIDLFQYNRILPQVRYTNMTRMTSTVPSDLDVNDRTDYSNKMKGINRQNSLYFLIPAHNETDEFHDVMEYEFFRYSNKDIWNRIDPGLYLLPQSHQLNLPEYYNRTNMFVYSSFSSYSDNASHINQIQPIMSVFNPTKQTIQYQNRIAPNLTYITDEDEITFANTVDHQPGVLNLDITNDRFCGRLTTNCYSFDERMELYEIQQLRMRLEAMDRGNIITPEQQICPETKEFAINCMCEHCEELSKTYGYNEDGLVGYLLKEFGSDTIPIHVEGTSHAYSRQMLIDYIMMNTIPKPAYQKDGIHLLRKRCERVVGYDKESKKWKGIGPQPIGGYDVINVQQHHPFVTMWNGDYAIEAYNVADILYVFHFESFPTTSTLQSFRMYADDFDISPYTLLLYKSQAWVWNMDGWMEIYFDSDFDPTCDDC